MPKAFGSSGSFAAGTAVYGSLAGTPAVQEGEGLLGPAGRFEGVGDDRETGVKACHSRIRSSPTLLRCGAEPPHQRACRTAFLQASTVTLPWHPPGVDAA